LLFFFVAKILETASGFCFFGDFFPQKMRQKHVTLTVTITHRFATKTGQKVASHVALHFCHFSQIAILAWVFFVTKMRVFWFNLSMMRHFLVVGCVSQVEFAGNPGPGQALAGVQDQAGALAGSLAGVLAGALAEASLRHLGAIGAKTAAWAHLGPSGARGAIWG
jgi:hypothetical protein